MAESSKIKIGFTYTDHFGDEYSASSLVEVFDELGETDLDVIGAQLNAFLIQIGYPRENSHILMDDLTEDECEALHGYLQELRERKDGNEENEE